jgi:predicted nucleic acid-binding protein
VDTNVLLRSAQPDSPFYEVATSGVESLLDRGERVFITPQNVVEFWSAATRPADVNGLGLTPERANQEIARLETILSLAPDVPGIYSAWRALVAAHDVTGVRVHDARLVAVMQVHGLTHLLTFDATDFQHYPGITVMHPADV